MSQPGESVRPYARMNARDTAAVVLVNTVVCLLPPHFTLYLQVGLIAPYTLKGEFLTG